MNPNALPSRRQLPYTLIALLVVVGIAVWGILTQYNPTSLTKTTPSNPSTAETQTTQLQKIITPNAFFYSKTFPKLDATFVSIPFSFTSSPQPLWLFLETQSGIPRIGRLIYHPYLASLAWPTVTDGPITLYQKEKRFNSVADFLKNPPAAGILIDPALSVLPKYSNLNTNLIPESGELDLKAHDYILTTYAPARFETDLNYYETIIDATSAQPNKNGELVWLIFAPDASESLPYSLGNIHVDYR